MRNGHYDKISNRLAIWLLLVAGLLSTLAIVQVLESEDLIHTGQASGWYIASLNMLSISQFS